MNENQGQPDELDYFVRFLEIVLLSQGKQEEFGYLQKKIEVLTQQQQASLRAAQANERKMLAQKKLNVTPPRASLKANLTPSRLTEIPFSQRATFEPNSLGNRPSLAVHHRLSSQSHSSTNSVPKQGLLAEKLAMGIPVQSGMQLSQISAVPGEGAQPNLEEHLNRNLGYDSDNTGLDSARYELFDPSSRSLISKQALANQSRDQSQYSTSTLRFQSPSLHSMPPKSQQ